MNVRRIFLLLFALPILAACQTESLAPLVASNIEITAALPPNRVSAAYLELSNNTALPIVVSAVTSAEFESVEIHETRVKNGIARMRKLSSLTIPAGATVILTRGGKHLMLSRPTKTPRTVTFTFHSDTSPLLSVTATVTNNLGNP